MALDLTTISHSDIAFGIDARSAENLIKDGFCEDLVNMDTNSQGHVVTRKGYQLYSGCVPLRATSVTYLNGDTDNLKITFDGSVDLSSATPSPIIVYGRIDVDSSGGTFTDIDNVRYYETYKIEDTETWTVGANTSTILQAEHGLSTSDLFVGYVASTSTTDPSNEIIEVDEVKIDNITYNVNIDYVNNDSDIEVYSYVVDRSDVSGTTDVHTFTIATGTHVETRLATEHLLSNLNIIPKFFVKSGTEWYEVRPDSLQITTNGDVSVTYQNNTGSTLEGKLILHAVDTANRSAFSVDGGEVGYTKIISNIANFFPFVALYSRSPLGVLSLIEPDGVTVDASAETMTITVSNKSTDVVNCELYYEFPAVGFNTIVLTDPFTTTATGDREDVQMTVWGICQDQITYRNSDRGGYINHIDSYNSELDQHLVAGMGGNLFAARPYATYNSDYLYPSLLPDISSQLNDTRVIGPTFYTSAPVLSRYRGYVLADNIDANRATISYGIFNPGTGQFQYTINLQNKQVLSSLGTPTTIDTVISTTSNQEDWLTVTSMNNSLLNGTFKIKAVSETATSITISVENDQIDSSDFDEYNGGGWAAIYTDQVVTTTISFAADDMVVSDLFEYNVKTVNGTTLVLSGVTGSTEVLKGFRVYGRRTSAVLPLRDSLRVSTVEDFVVGDVVSITGYDRQFKVIAIDTVNKTITIDESIEFEDTQDDSTLVYVPLRWIPIEVPDTTFNAPSTSQIFHFDTNAYAGQSTIRSTTVADGLYLTNYDDEVLKYDGTNLYKAGIPRWQPHLFVQVDTTVDSIVPSNPSVAVSAVANNKFKVALSDEQSFEVGNRIEHDNDNAKYTIIKIDDDGTDGYIYVDDDISGAAAGNISKLSVYRFYFRLNAIDANNNIIASATTGSSDYIIELAQSAQIKGRLVGLPVLNMLDYDRLEIEVYRTMADSVAPYYRTQVIRQNFNKASGYIDFIEHKNDEDLRDFDPVAASQEGAELGNTWSHSLRAKYLTSADNRLILANVKDYAELDIVMREINGATILAADLADGTGSSKFSFKRSNLDPLTVTNMSTRVTYEFRHTDDSLAIAGITNNGDDTFTVNIASHGITEAGSWIYLYHEAEGLVNSLTYAGWWQVAEIVDADNVKIRFVHDSGYAVANEVDRAIIATSALDVPVLLGVDGNYNMKNGNADSASSPYEFIAMRRLANAINASMRMVDLDIPAYSSFTPWMTANAGNEYNTGQLVIRQTQVQDTTLEFTADSSVGTIYDLFINNLRRVAGSSTSSSQAIFASRILVSYRNYPELFDAPTVPLDADSRSAIDINTADGQEITGVIPFFGDSAFGGSQKEGIVVVFKTNSIYLVDINSKEAGLNPVQKIESHGQGCTAPYSIASTDKGIMFANESGIYRLNRDLSVTYVGALMERKWENVNKQALTEVTGHNYDQKRQYKLSVPTSSDSTNSEVFVYDHTREGVDQPIGAWTRYNNHPATGWANLASEAFFGSVNGRVFTIRNTGSTSDYRDDTDAISWQLLYKALSFGVSSRRKMLASVVTHMRVLADTSGVSLESAVDLNNTFESAGSLPTPTSCNQKVISLRSALPTRRGLYFQLKYSNSTLDEPTEIAGIDFVVAGLSHKGIKESEEV